MQLADLKLQLEKAELNDRHLTSELKHAKKELSQLKKSRIKDILSGK